MQVVEQKRVLDACLSLSAEVERQRRECAPPASLSLNVAGTWEKFKKFQVASIWASFSPCERTRYGSTRVVNAKFTFTQAVSLLSTTTLSSVSTRDQLQSRLFTWKKKKKKSEQRAHPKLSRCRTRRTTLDEDSSWETSAGEASPQGSITANDLHPQFSGTTQRLDKWFQLSFPADETRMALGLKDFGLSGEPTN